MNETKPQPGQYGICPLAYAAFPVQMQASAPQPGGRVITVPSGQMGTVGVEPPCVGSRCQWWDDGSQRCVVVKIALLAAALEQLTANSTMVADAIVNPDVTGAPR